MATAAGDSTGYGGGAGGKFRRMPFRKSQTTPYDRPPTALRLTRRDDDSSSSGGWLSRIVDPASKLITSSAHKLFSSVFRKRLLPPPQASKDEEVEILENHFGDAITEAPSSIQERNTTVGNTQNGSMTEGVAGLANILKQKTFTRSEIDRLTALLHSREEVKTAAEAPAGHARRNPYEVSGADLTPAVRSNVNVASPTDLAKAYMGSMSTRVSPSTIGTYSHAVKEEIPSFKQKTLSAVPRSRGRSAIYSMARAPYFKAQQTVTKGLGTANDAPDGISLLSSQKTLKRRSSVLENDIGSVGPIRRIRQKPNLLYPKPSDLPSASSSRLNEERGEKSPFPNSHVSSKSVEMGQKILQQLEKLTPPKDKYNENKPGGISSMKLTPSMLSGQARKSLETVDLSKYVQEDEVCEKKVDSGDTYHETRDSTTKEQDEFNNNGSKVLMISSSNVYLENGDARSRDHDVISDTNNSAPIVVESTMDVPQKSPAFQMSAYEDDWDMDDDAYVTSSVNEGKRNLGASYPQSNGKLPEIPSFSEASKVGKPAFLGVESSSNSVLKNANIVEASNTAEKGISHDMSDSVLNNTIGSSVPSSQPVKTSVADKAGLATKTVSFDLRSSEKLSPPSLKQSSAAESSSVADVTTSSFAFGAATANAPIKSQESNNNSNDSVGLFKQADTAPTSVAGSSASTIGSFGSLPLTSTAPSPVTFSSPSPFSVSSTEGVNNSATSTTPINGSSENVKVSVAFPSFQSTFRGSSVTSDSATTTEKTKGTDLVNSPSSNLFGAAPAGASSFEFGASSTKAQLQSSSDNVSNGSIFGGQTSPSATASASTTTSSAPSSSSFGFGSSSSGSSSSSSSSVAAAVFGSVSSASTSIFGGSSQQTSSPPVFGSSTLNNSSSGVSFGASAAATPSSSSASSGFSFGLSPISAAANGSSTAPSGNPSSGFGFGAPANGGSSSSGGGSSSVFGFGASSSAAAPSSSSTFSFGASPATASSSAPISTFSFGASPAATGSSSAPTSTFSFGASPAAPSSSSSAPSSTFSFGASPASSSATFSFGASPATTSSSAAPSSTFSFGASSSAAAASTFSFGASSTPTPSTTPSTFLFGASSATTTSVTTTAAPSFPFSSAPPPTTSQPAFGSNSVFGFGSTPPSDQMSMEDSMVEDSMHQSPTPVFGQTPTPTNFSFGMAQPQPQPQLGGANPFQFGGQQNQLAAASPNPFQASGSFDGGSFSLGAGGNDKSNRRIVKVKSRNRKK